MRTGQSPWWHNIVIVLVCCAIFVPKMGSYGMFDPWETHYTEVARQFIERGDWLSTYWHNGTGPEGHAETNFWSKPVGSFWMSGMALKLFGLADDITINRSPPGYDPGEYLTTGSVEWAVRLPFFLCALFGIYCIYLMCSRLFSRRAGILAGIVLATAPMYFMIARQAMTDMPYVGLISGGLALFMLAVFGEEKALARRHIQIARWKISWPHDGAFYLFVASFVLFMVLQLVAITAPLTRVPLPIKPIFGGRPSAAVAMLVYTVAAGIVLWLLRKTRTRNEVYLYTFYMVTAIAGLAKGLIGALQPGFVVLLYFIAGREWHLLTRIALLRGLLIAGCVFAPWYHGMVMRHGKAFWNTLMGTEQLRRLTVGEQAQAKGTFEYYLQQIGYALFPWIAFLPVALARVFAGAFSHRRGEPRSGEDRARLFVVCWFAAVVGLFSLTITKYHHYILPAVPPAAILIALFLDDLLDRRVKAVALSVLVSASVLLSVAIDLINQPAHWVWMFTYLYTSNWAQGVPTTLGADWGPLAQWKPIPIYAGLFAVALVPLFVERLRKAAVWFAAAVAVCVGGLVLNWYIVGCAPHWSQKTVLQTYYRTRKPGEQLVAWQFNWRGETWYTGAQVVVSKSLDNKKIIAWLNERSGKRFFFITERSRYASLRNMLPTPQGKKTLKIVDDTNVHYVLAAAQL